MRRYVSCVALAIFTLSGPAFAQTDATASDARAALDAPTSERDAARAAAQDAWENANPAERQRLEQQWRAEHPEAAKRHDAMKAKWDAASPEERAEMARERAAKRGLARPQ